jgi:hypothetical protein
MNRRLQELKIKTRFQMQTYMSKGSLIPLQQQRENFQIALQMLRRVSEVFLAMVTRSI